jgi:acyl-CoA thioesterase FadM
MGHMNVMWYVGKFDEATWQILAAMGAGPSRLRKQGFGLVAVEQYIEYKRELLTGDLLTISLVDSGSPGKSFRFILHRAVFAGFAESFAVASNAWGWHGCCGRRTNQN